MQTLSVVLLNYNGRVYLEKFLPNVVFYSKPHEVVVVDNGSTDDSSEFVKENFPDVKLIPFEDNYGFCGGYNKVIPVIDSDFIVLLNTDVEVTKNWIDPVFNFLNQIRNTKPHNPKF